MTDRGLTRRAAVEQSADTGAAAVAAYLRLLAGRQPQDRFFDIRAIGRHRVQRSFVAATRPSLAAARVREDVGSSDVYLGVALRTTNRSGGKQAIDGSHLVFIECDRATAADGLRGFRCPPTMVIASGTPGHLHAYWLLRHRYANEQIERANRQLALHLGGDLASVDIARVLRPPGTLNHKHTPPAPVELVSHRPGVHYSLADLTAGLHEPKPPTSPEVTTPRRRAVATDALDGRLRSIPTEEYVRALTGRTADRAGKISCPFHPDDTPSLQLYAAGTFYCFGCRRGGGIYDFAAALWLPDQSVNAPLRGRSFNEVRQRLLAMFLGDDAAA